MDDEFVALVSHKLFKNQSKYTFIGDNGQNKPSM